MQPRKLADDPHGLTLVELVAVIFLLAIFSAVATRQFSFFSQQRANSSLRKFIDVWQLCHDEALRRGETYRLILDLDNNGYYVRREVRESGNTYEHVDYLRNLRIDDQSREKRGNNGKSDLNIEEEFERLDSHQGLPLDLLFFQLIYGDLGSNIRLGMPLHFPSLGAFIRLDGGLRFKRVILDKNLHMGQVALRFVPRGASQFSIVQFENNGRIFSVFMNPVTGEVSIEHGEVDIPY